MTNTMRSSSALSWFNRLHRFQSSSSSSSSRYHHYRHYHQYQYYCHSKPFNTSNTSNTSLRVHCYSSSSIALSSSVTSSSSAAVTVTVTATATATDHSNATTTNVTTTNATTTTTTRGGVSNSDTIDTIDMTSIKTAILEGRVKNDPFTIETNISIISKNTKYLDQLSMKHILNVIWACEKFNDHRCSHIYWIYEHVRATQVVPIEMFDRMLSICAKKGFGDLALTIINDYITLGYPHKNSALCNVLLSIVKNRKNDRDLQVQKDNAKKYYDLYKQHQKDNNEKVDERVYVETAKLYSSFSMSPEVLQVLKDMTADNYEPSIWLCSGLLENALVKGDVVLVTVLANWYLTHFDANIEYGVLTRILQFASSHGHSDLARVGISILSKSQYKARIEDYECWLRASIIDEDFAGAIESLVEAESKGLEMFGDSDDSPENTLKINGAIAVQDLMALKLSLSVRKLDEVYFALVEMRRNNQNIPRILVNAIIMAAGKMGQLDRSFATFQEYHTVFGLIPNIHAYNALLCATALSKSPNVNSMFLIFKDMEDAGFTPNGLSYSYLLNVMVETNSLDGFEEIISHMNNHIKTVNNTHLHRSMRRLAVACAKDNNWDQVENILSALKYHGDNAAPQFFIQRLDNIKSRLKQKDTKDAKDTKDTKDTKDAEQIVDNSLQ